MNKEVFIEVRDDAISILNYIDISDILKQKLIKLVKEDFGFIFDDDIINYHFNDFDKEYLETSIENIKGTVYGILALNNEVSKDMFIYLVFVERIWMKW